MRSVRNKDTAAEVALRRALHARGLRFRLDRKLLATSRRRVDIAFISARVAVLVDGCFWHRCPIHATVPKANARWWSDKLQANQRRDADTDKRLLAAGWYVVRVWEHEAPGRAASRIATAVNRRRYRGSAIR